MEIKKKAYVKPMVVYCDFSTGELRGNPELMNVLHKQETAKISLCSCPEMNAFTYIQAIDNETISFGFKDENQIYGDSK